MKIDHTTLAAAVCAALVSLATPAAAAPGRFEFDKAPGRLSKDVVPSRYALSLRLDPASPRFDGEATIQLAVRRAVPAIVVNAHLLTPLSARLGNRALKIVADERAQTWRLVPADGRRVEAGSQALHLAWNGPVQHSGSGLFDAPHQVDGKPANMLATQLEAVYARMVFPGFDEPAFRAVFELTVLAPSGLEVIANMPEQRAAQPQGDAVLHRFAPTPPMPSYLFSVTVGRFDALAGSAAGVPLRIVTTPGKRELGAYALAATQQLLPYYNDYFGVPYALPKLDQIAIPSGRRGAMEDWGAISYSENALLFDPAQSNALTQRRIFGTVAHEMAHQWFGDLVTASWWDEIWLNEAFATWMAEKASAHFNPQWQTALNRRRQIDAAMTRDAGKSTRPIRSGDVPEDRVFDVFDDITYTKGGAVLSMVEGWIGDAAFRRGLAAYMRDRQFSNATAADLWFHIGRASGRDVGKVVAGWTDQPGLPLVAVASRCDGGRTVVDLTQRRFVVGGGSGDATRWKIPLTLQFGAGAPQALLFDGERRSVRLPGCPAEPLLVNASGEGYYRVVYAKAEQQRLLQSFQSLPATARASLLADTLALAQGGQLPLADYLPLLAATAAGQGAEQPALMRLAMEGLEFMDASFAGTPAQAALRQAARALLVPQLEALGWDARPGEDSEVQALRLGLVEDLARYGHQPTLDRARALFDAEQSGGKPLPPASRAAVIAATGIGADAAHFRQLVARLKNATSEEDRWLYAHAVGAVRDPALAAEAVALALDPALMNEQAVEMPKIVAQGHDNGELAYRYVSEHWQALADRAGTMFGGRSWLLPGAATGFNDAGRARQLMADQERLAGAPGRASAARVAGAIDLAAAVRTREAARIVPALETLTQQLVKAGS